MEKTSVTTVTEGEMVLGVNKLGQLDKSSPLNKAGCETGEGDCVFRSSGDHLVGQRGKVVL